MCGIVLMSSSLNRNPPLSLSSASSLVSVHSDRPLQADKASMACRHHLSSPSTTIDDDAMPATNAVNALLRSSCSSSNTCSVTGKGGACWAPSSLTNKSSSEKEGGWIHAHNNKSNTNCTSLRSLWKCSDNQLGNLYNNNIDDNSSSSSNDLHSFPVIAWSFHEDSEAQNEHNHDATIMKRTNDEHYTIDKKKEGESTIGSLGMNDDHFPNQHQGKLVRSISLVSNIIKEMQSFSSFDGKGGLDDERVPNNKRTNKAADANDSSSSSPNCRPWKKRRVAPVAERPRFMTLSQPSLPMPFSSVAIGSVVLLASAQHHDVAEKYFL